MFKPTRMTTEIDFTKDGKQVGYVRLPHSSNVSAYGWLGIPIAQIKNGDGPTVLLLGGNHGDEYEGQIGLSRLIRNLQPKDIRGCVIILPMTNFPAAMAGWRTSPLDSGNLNRMFPGDPDGSPTEMIAHYVETVLMPMCDGMLDLHSGGRTLHYVPSALMIADAGAEPDPKTLAAMKAFGAPIAYITATGDSRTSLAGAIRQGVVAIGTELGGTGQVTRETLRVAEAGIANFLSHFGVTDQSVAKPQPASRVMRVEGHHYYIYASTRGWFEPFFDLGDTVSKGQDAGLIHFLDEPLREPVPVKFDHGGLVICRRPPVPVERGDCIAHLATDIE
jgi:predicted deacylase